ncbi:MAG: hypothetical protein AMXMBFR33_70890 [Candidatus Xenobia bacterium]
MARFFIRLLLLAGVCLGVLFFLKARSGQQPLPRPLNLTPHTVRVAVEGRPSELPLYALHALLSKAESAGQVTLEIEQFADPGERWRQLAAGEIDLVLASLDEFALAVPRFNPGQVLFATSLSVGSDAVVAMADTPEAQVLRLAFVSGSPGEYLAARLVAQETDRVILPIPAPNLTVASEWYEQGAVQALAVCEPALRDYLKRGDQILIQTSSQAPITHVWVASRQALRNERNPRVSRADLEEVAGAWFVLISELRQQPGLALGAIARGNDSQVSEVEQAFVGLEFLSLQESQALNAQVLVPQLDLLSSFWSLSGALNAHKPDSFEAELEQSMLGTIKAPAIPAPPPEPSATHSPTLLLSPSASPLPLLAPSPSPETPDVPDPFSPVPMPAPSP